jgi:endonuclease YncB( thermonuclease family)
MLKPALQALKIYKALIAMVVQQKLGIRFARPLVNATMVFVVMGCVILSVTQRVSAQTKPHSSYTLTGKVIRVSDGDTLTIRGTENQKIRLASIDAPEKKSGSNRPAQPYSEPSREYLAKLVAGQTITVLCFEKDRYDRHICDVPVNQTTANRLLVEAGLAWANQQAGGKYLRDKELLVLEQQARAAKRGLWVEPNPVSPWVWRTRCWQQGQC